MLSRFLISVAVLFLVAPAFAFDVCAPATDDGCEHAYDWHREPAYAPYRFDAGGEPLSAKTLAALEALVARKLKPELISPELKTLGAALSPAEFQACVLNALLGPRVIGVVLRRYEALPCAPATQALFDTHFAEPNEKTGPDRRILEELLPLLRPEIAGKIEARLLAIVDELKKEYLAYLKKRGVAEKFLKLVRAIEYSPANCFRTKGMDRISLESQKLVNVCQGFAWGPGTVHMMSWILAHEIGHVLDVCDLGLYGQLKFPRETTKIDDVFRLHPTPDLYREALASAGDGALPAGEQVCNYRNLQEAYADVVAGLIAPPVIARLFPSTAELARLGYLSAQTRGCSPKQREYVKDVPPHLRHPLARHRLAYLLSRPAVRAQLSCVR